MGIAAFQLPNLEAPLAPPLPSVVIYFSRFPVMRFSLAALFLLLMPAARCQQPPSQPSVDTADFCNSIGQNLEHPEALADACRFVLSLRRKLPNVVCDQTTSRFVRPSPGYYGRRMKDELTAHVIYEDGRLRYTDVRINGKPETVENPARQGQYTKGEFGTDLIFAFLEENRAAYRFLRKDSHAHHHVFVYEAKVLRENNHGWVLGTNGRDTYPEFVAEISVDQITHRIVRFDLKATPASDFPLSDVRLSTDYEDLPLGDGTYFVLPVESESNSCLWNMDRKRIAFCNDNVLRFKNCHKFGASSRIVTDGVGDSPK